MGVGSVSKQETIPQMFKVSETTTITFHILDDAIKSLHRPIRESASVGAVSTHSFDYNERVDDASGDNIMTKIWGRENSVRLRVGVIAITQKAFVLRRAHKYWIFNENTKKTG